MHSASALVLTALLLLLASAPAQTSAKSADIDQLLQRGEVAGIALAEVKRGRVLPVRVAGYANLATKKEVEPSTVFEAASLSKPVVAYGVLQLIDRGLIGLDARVASYITDEDLAKDARWSEVTIRMLLNHTSGLPNEVRAGDRLFFAFTPGSRFSYSGAGFTLLQRVIEAVTKQPFESYMKSAVFRPLQMTNSSFVWQPAYEATKANGHNSVNQPTELRRPMTPRAPSSLHTTANDYARFVQAVLLGKGLKRETWKLMLSKQTQVQADCVVCFAKPIGARATGLAWGFGWGLEGVDAPLKFFHWGENNDDYEAFVIGDMATQSGIVILSNSGNGLSIVPTLVRAALPGPHPAFAWMGYDEVESPVRAFLRRVVDEGAEAALKNAVPRFTEAQWNRIGYNLLARGRVGDAIKIFELNVRQFPNSANVYDSLGEAYMAAHRDEEAITSYRKSLELDPLNGNARAMLRKLETNALQQRPKGF